MGNVHAFAQRVTAISVACLATAGFVFCFLGGFSCNYLEVTPMVDRLLQTPDGLELESGESAFIGVQCDSPFYSDSDKMWNMSQIFLYVGLALGGLTTLMAWASSIFAPPSNFTWRSISVLAACAAVIEVPIFLMFESEPCNMDISRQTCSLAVGGYLNITSIVLFVLMTLWTQCLRPPDWKKETEAWRNTDREVKVGVISIPSGGDSREGTDSLSAPPRDSPDAYRESPPSTPAYWSVEPKRNEQPQFRHFDECNEQPAPVKERADDKDIHVFHDLETPAVNTAVDSVVPSEQVEKQEEEEKHRSFWAFGRGRSSKAENSESKSRSLWAFGGRGKSQPNEATEEPPSEPLDEQESGDENGESTTTPASQLREVQPISGPFSWDAEDIEIPAPADQVNRERSLLSSDDEDEETEAPPEQLIEEEPVRKGAAAPIVFRAKSRGSTDEKVEQQEKLHAVPVAVPKKKKSKKAMKVTIICPDGSEEKKTLSTRVERELVSPKPFDEAMDPRQTSYPTPQREKHSEPSEDKTNQMAARDFVLTHSIPRPASKRPQEKEDDAYATTRVRSTPVGEVPVGSLSIPPTSSSHSYDVSEMTPGLGETEVLQHETMAILEDLARLE